MPFYLSNLNTWSDVIVLIICTFSIAMVLSLIFYRKSEYLSFIFISIFSFTILGTIIGYITGQSREPAVTSVLPSVLTFVGGVSIYVLGKSDNPLKLLIPLCITSFSISLFLGIQWGIDIREKYYRDLKYVEIDRNATQYEFERLKQSYVINLQKIMYEKKLQDMRKELGLPYKSTEAFNKSEELISNPQAGH